MKAEELEAPAASEDGVWNTSENMKIGGKFPNLLPMSHSQVNCLFALAGDGQSGGGSVAPRHRVCPWKVPKHHQVPQGEGGEFPL